jgi:hypothetical protein
MKLHQELINCSTDLNGTQKNIIEGTLNIYLEDIAKLKPSDAIKALKAVTGRRISPEEKEYFINQDIFDDIKFIREILLHPCPENRCSSYLSVAHEKGYSTFKLERNKIKTVNVSGDVELKNGRIILGAYVLRNNLNKEGYIIAKEQTGLLGLTGREDDETPPVNKQAVVNYVHTLINNTIVEQNELLKKENPARSPTFFSNKSTSKTIIKIALNALTSAFPTQQMMFF